MGNNGSSNGGSRAPHPPNQWTHSFPRDNRRLQKLGVAGENRVLPEHGPVVQCLRPTENGRSLHVAGTITGRKMSQMSDNHSEGHSRDTRDSSHHRRLKNIGSSNSPHIGGRPSKNHLVAPQSLPGYMAGGSMSPPCAAHPNGPPVNLHAMHSNSLTHLHQQCVLHPSPSMDPNRSGSMHELRFGSPPSKVYTSEPDLRVGSNGGAVVIPPQMSPHTIIGQSPTKGRIKSKKRNRAPPPPAASNGAMSDGYIHDHSRASSEVPRAVHWGTSDTLSRPPSQVSSSRSKSKGRKMGLFRKKNDSRKSDNESSYTDEPSRPRYRNSPMASPMGRTKKEKQERARSVDCLQHELRRGSPIINGERAGRGSSSDDTTSSSHENDRRRSQTIERDSRRNHRDEIERRMSITLERNPREPLRESKRNNAEYRPHGRLDERQSYDSQWNQPYMEKPVETSTPYRGRYGSEKMSLERRASSSTARTEKDPLNRAFDEWEEAEKEMLRRKRISENMKKELLTAAKNLKKPSESKVEERKVSTVTNVTQEKSVSTESSPQKTSAENDIPKTFFFGMKPENPVENNSKTSIPKPVQMEEVRIEGTAVGYSKRNAEVIQRSRSKSKDSGNVVRVSDNGDNNKTPNVRKANNDVDEFAVAIERRNRNNFVRDDLFGNSIRREDGGYHSRQNSGSFHLENENPSDEDIGITVNLRPILPKRQREIPRFSPNAAWRFLGEEPFLTEENLNESRSSEEVDVVFEDKIRGYARPVAPPRGSGEKSADSGISGDAGSPGPMQEFEPIIPTHNIKIVNGPLAASSPVASGRSEARRAWTPAQDLDDNSLDGSGEPSPNRVVQNVNSLSAPPKLTSRANMFSLFGIKDARIDNSYSQTDELNTELSKPEKMNTTVEESTQTVGNFRKLKRSISGNLNIKNGIDDSREQGNQSNTNENISQNDKWRDNWSMTRSIPNSLNNCDNPKVNKKLQVVKKDVNNSNSHVTSHRRVQSEEETTSEIVGGRPRGSSFIQNAGQAGHIMYLPEYNSRKVPLGEENLPVEIRSRDLNSSKHLNRSYTPELRKPMLHQDPGHDVTDSSPFSLPHFFAGKSPIGGRIKRGKKFSYQSTVRVLEKRKIEEQLDREVAEKERQRLQESAAMRQVEEEFQLKREREKKRLKQQLKIYQVMQGAAEREHNSGSPTFTRTVSLNYPSEEDTEPDRYGSDTHQDGARITKPKDHAFSKQYSTNSLVIHPASRKMTDKMNTNTQMENFSSGFHVSSRDSYFSDNSRSYSNGSNSKDYSPKDSTTLEDEYPVNKGDYSKYFDRQSKDNNDSSLRIVPREDNINTSRRYSADETSSVSSVTGRYPSSSEVSNLRRAAPDGAPASSITVTSGPRGEAVMAAKQRNGLLTQELPEHQFPRREYREYRRSQRSPNSRDGGISDNYRRDFSRGQVQTLEDKTSRHGSQEALDTPPSAVVTRVYTTTSNGSNDPPVRTHVIQLPNQQRVTNYFEHPPVTGNMGAVPANMLQMGPGEAFNRHVVQPFAGGSSGVGQFRPRSYSPTMAL